MASEQLVVYNQPVGAGTRFAKRVDSGIQAVGGVTVLKTAAEMSVGYIGARAIGHYIEKSGVLDKSVKPENMKYVKAGIGIVGGGILVMKTRRARVIGLGAMVDGIAELIIPTIEEKIDTMIAESAAGELTTPPAGTSGQT